MCKKHLVLKHLQEAATTSTPSKPKREMKYFSEEFMSPILTEIRYACSIFILLCSFDKNEKKDNNKLVSRMKMQSTS